MSKRNAITLQKLCAIWKVLFYVNELIPVHFPDDIGSCFRPIVYEMWKMCDEDFTLLKVLGRGPRGKVLLARCKVDCQNYALKVIQKPRNVTFCYSDRSEREDTQVHYKIVTMKCPFLNPYRYFFQTVEKLYFVSDYIDGGELFMHLFRDRIFTEAQIYVGVEYLHNNGIIYRDLKPENVLLTGKGNVILTDYYPMKDFPSDNYVTSLPGAGTIEYYAPEIIRGEQYTKAIDWWAFGTLIYEMLTGLPPFYRENQSEMLGLILNGLVSFPDHVTSEAVKDLILKMLDRNVTKRTEYGLNIRSHPWFASIDWQSLVELKITPPYIPPVKTGYEDSRRQIDEEFLEESVEAEDTGKNEFEGFTFD